MIEVFSNSLGDEEIRAVEDVFSSKWLGKGKQCEEFEKEFASHLQVPRVLLTNNCTAAIYIALQALGIGIGDEVIVSTINFVGCVNAVIDVGANPVFADVDASTLNIVPNEIERLKTRRTKAAILLHYGGHPCDMDEIRTVCGDDIAIIEDSANSVSSSYKGVMCGTIGDAGVFSFDAMKMLVMADGGALYLKDRNLVRRAQAYRYLGLSQETVSGIDTMKEKKSRWWEYDLETTSGRFISNDVLAVIGRVQLKKLSGFIERRKQIWKYYQQEVSNVPGIICPPEPLPDTMSSYYLYWIQLPTGRDELAQYLSENGIYTTFRYYPLHLVKYLGSGCRLPVAEHVNEITLNLPLHQNLTDNDVEKIIDLVKQYYKRHAW